MPKLATPVQYEPSLDGLNDIRPLQLADEAKVVIPYPVLCKNPPTVDKPAVGMFARCDRQGSMLINVPPWATEVYEIDIDIAVTNGGMFYSFPIMVQGVLAIYTKVGEYMSVEWSNPTYSRSYAYIHENVWKYLSFMGTKIYFRVSGAPATIGTLSLKGFY